LPAADKVLTKLKRPRPKLRSCAFFGFLFLFLRGHPYTNMKIDRISTPATKPARRTGRSGATQGAEFAQALSAADAAPESTASSSTGAVAPLARVDAILAAQEVGDVLDEERRAHRHGQDLLDRLDELRLALLDGRLSVAVVERLAALAAGQRYRVRDPRLAEVLAEIELRAAVELAKLGR